MPKTKTTKIARVRALLERPKGASLATICKATGWQPHSARAAISGLRKAGHAVELCPPEEKDGASVYRVTAAGEAAE